MTWLLKSLHFTDVDIFGAKLGAFSRDHKLTTQDYEMLIVAEKSVGLNQLIVAYIGPKTKNERSF